MSNDNLEKIQCIGFIMDGNRRWARARMLPTQNGHSEGYAALQNIIRTVGESGIPHMVCYAFSTENWKRTPEEVQALMELMRIGITRLSEGERKEGVNYRIIGQRDKLPHDLQDAIERMESENCANPKLTVWIALSYGGRAEIIAAANSAIKKGEEVTEESFRKMLWTDEMPDPDLVIRTGGEHRISNFLLWQSAYSEFAFTETLWPDFGEKELKGIVEEYGKRKRRKGA